MAQSIKQYKKGTTLIELVLYMCMFIILVSGVLYSSFYMQSILQYNALEYKTGENIYRQLNLLQQHLSVATKVEIVNSSLKIYNPYGYVEQFLENGILHMRYVYTGKIDKDIVVYPYLKFEKFSFTRETGHETLFGNSVLWVDVERVDSRGKAKELREWLISSTLSKNP